MPLPKPEPGLVIRYDYLWLNEKPRTSGKERPACLIATLDDEADPQLVLILPITHSRPKAGPIGIEIPQAVGKHLGLDDARSWIVISEANIDFWPNAGLAPLPGKRGVYAYGFLPPNLFAQVRNDFVKLFEARRAKLVRR